MEQERKRGQGGRPKRDGAKHSKPDTEEVNPDMEVIEEPEVDLGEGVNESIRQMLEDNKGNLAGWLQRVGKDDPYKALCMFRDFSEFHLAKKQRTESKKEQVIPVKVHFESTAAREERLAKKKPKATADDYK